MARKIVNEPNVVLAIGSWSTTSSLAAAPIFTEAKIPQISPTSSHPDFSKQSPYQFRQNNTDDVLAVYNADTIQEKLGANKVVIPYSQDDWGVFTDFQAVQVSGRINPHGGLMAEPNNRHIVIGFGETSKASTRRQVGNIGHDVDFAALEQFNQVLPLVDNRYHTNTGNIGNPGQHVDG